MTQHRKVMTLSPCYSHNDSLKWGSCLAPDIQDKVMEKMQEFEKEKEEEVEDEPADDDDVEEESEDCVVEIEEV